MGRLVALLAALLAVPAAGAQHIDPNILGDTLRPILDPVAEDGVASAESVTGLDLSTEEIDFKVALDVFNVDYELIGIVFGGGKIQADVDARIVLDFRAISVARLDQAFQQASGNANMSLSNTLGIPSNRTAVTAETVRTLGGGILLEMFQAYQERATTRILESTVPGMRVLSTVFEWSNTLPLEGIQQQPLPNPEELDPQDPSTWLPSAPLPTLREPPLRLEATLRMQYLERVSLFELLEPQWRGERDRAADPVRAQVEENQTIPFRHRNAFSVLGFSQFLNFQIPAGWRVNITLGVPDGFTIEGVTDELDLQANHEQARYVLDGSQKTYGVHQGALATLSSRFIVTSTLLVAVVLAGFLLRVPSELLAGAALRVRDARLARTRARRAGAPAAE